MKCNVKLSKRILSFVVFLLFAFNSFAAVVSDNDGAAFITKSEFDTLKQSFQSQIDNYNFSIDSKIDGAIASYLAGIKLSSTQNLNIYNQFAEKTLTMLNSDSLSIAESSRPKTKADITICRLGGFTQTNKYFAICRYQMDNQAAGRELCSEQVGDVKKLIGYYTDFKMYYDFTGMSQGGICPSSAHAEVLQQFKPNNGNLITTSTSFTFSTDSGWSATQRATGQFRREGTTVEEFNYMAFPDFSFKTVGVNYGTAVPVSGETTTYKGNLETCQNAGVYNGSSLVYAASIAATQTLTGFRIGRESESTLTICHPKYANDLKQAPTAVDYATTMTAGVKLFTVPKDGKIKIQLDTNETSLRVAVADKNFKSGWTLDTGGELVKINNKSYTSGYTVLTKEELANLTFDAKKDTTYWIKWNNTSGTGNTTKMTFPKLATLVVTE